MDEILASVILSGGCERHPRLRLVLGESGIDESVKRKMIRGNVRRVYRNTG